MTRKLSTLYIVHFLRCDELYYLTILGIAVMFQVKMTLIWFNAIYQNVSMTFTGQINIIIKIEISYVHSTKLCRHVPR